MSPRTSDLKLDFIDIEKQRLAVESQDLLSCWAALNDTDIAKPNKSKIDAHSSSKQNLTIVLFSWSCSKYQAAFKKQGPSIVLHGSEHLQTFQKKPQVRE